jgi:hypothetical protein
MFGTEVSYADNDLAAKQGAAFVAAHFPTEKVKTEAWKCQALLVARYYSFGGIEQLAGKTSP